MDAMETLERSGFEGEAVSPAGSVSQTILAVPDMIDCVDAADNPNSPRPNPPSMKIDEILDILAPGVFSENGKMVSSGNYALKKKGLSYLSSIYFNEHFRDSSTVRGVQKVLRQYEWLRDNVRSYYEATFDGTINGLPKSMFDIEMFLIDTMFSVRKSFDEAHDALNERDAINLLGLDMRRKIDSGDFEGLHDYEIAKLKSNHFDRQTSADMKLEEKLLELPTRDLRHAPAYIFVIGFDYSQPTHKEMINSFGKILNKPLSIYSSEASELLKKIAYEDGAVLINSSKEIIATNANLNNTSIPHLIERNMGLFGYAHSEEKEDLDKIGFLDPNVSTRNNNSLAASYSMPNTVIYTLSEETGNIRRMENGLIPLSTYPGESVLLRLIEDYLPDIHINRGICR